MVGQLYYLRTQDPRIEGEVQKHLQKVHNEEPALLKEFKACIQAKDMSFRLLKSSTDEELIKIYSSLVKLIDRIINPTSEKGKGFAPPPKKKKKN